MNETYEERKAKLEEGYITFRSSLILGRAKERIQEEMDETRETLIKYASVFSPIERETIETAILAAENAVYLNEYKIAFHVIHDVMTDVVTKNQSFFLEHASIPIPDVTKQQYRDLRYLITVLPFTPHEQSLVSELFEKVENAFYLDEDFSNLQDQIKTLFESAQSKI